MRDVWTPAQLAALEQAFGESKAEQDSFLKNRTDDIFVKTDFYDRAQVKGKCLLVGRKGSGKTALLYGHEELHKERYYLSEKIELDDLPFTQLFNFFYDDFVKSTESVKEKIVGGNDVLDFIEPGKVAHYAWKNSIVGACVLKTGAKLLEEDASVPFLTDDERVTLRGCVATLAGAFGLEAEDTGLLTKVREKRAIVYPLLVFFFNEVQEVIEHALGLDVSRLGVALAAITAALIEKLSNKVDPSLSAACEIIERRLAEKSKLAFVSLDKFDDFYDSFYKDISKRTGSQDTPAGGSVSNQKNFLHILLEGLVLAGRDLSVDESLKWMHCLFTIPMDKFLELQLRERRDLEQAHLLFVEWNPLELYEFANRRIADALGLHGRLRENAWNEVFPKFVKNGSSNVHVQEDSFMYVVRHTLWKPREIQLHVLRIVEEIRKNEGMPLTDQRLRICVQETTKEIVRTEFRVEFSAEYPGLNKALNKLESSNVKSVMPYSHYVNLVGDIELSDEIVTKDEIITRHFQMGLIGVRQIRPRQVRGKNPTITQNRLEVSYIFSFNSMDTNPFTDNSFVVVHPMFFDQLGISHTESYIVNEMSWDMFNI